MVKIKPVRVEGCVAYIPLTQGYEAVVDIDDLGLVGGFNWCAQVNGRTVYAIRKQPVGGGRRVTVRMHREILGTSPGVDVDHIDHDGLNNRRINLRVCTHQQNNCNRQTNVDNSSGFKGVGWDKSSQKWRARLTVNGEVLHLGLYNTPEEAHEAYQVAGKEHHRDFGHTGNLNRRVCEANIQLA